MFMFLMRGNNNVKALKEMHVFEVAAETIYRLQIPRTKGYLQEDLLHAAENEKKHKENLLIEIKKEGEKASFFVYPLYVLAYLFGIFSSYFGLWVMMMINIIIETQAVYDYQKIALSGALKKNQIKMLEQNIEDEKEHITKWQAYLWKVPPRVPDKKN